MDNPFVKKRKMEEQTTLDSLFKLKKIKETDNSQFKTLLQESNPPIPFEKKFKYGSIFTMTIPKQ